MGPRCILPALPCFARLADFYVKFGFLLAHLSFSPSTVYPHPMSPACPSMSNLGFLHRGGHLLCKLPLHLAWDVVGQSLLGVPFPLAGLCPLCPLLPLVARGTSPPAGPGRAPSRPAESDFLAPKVDQNQLWGLLNCRWPTSPPEFLWQVVGGAT